MTFVLGLTGSIATGKSSVAQIFKEHKIPVIEGDALTHSAQEKGADGFKAIVDEFGSEFLTDDGSLDRKKLGKLVFADQSQLQRLERVLDPIIRLKIQKELENFKKSQVPLVVVELPLLFEKNYEEMMNQIMVSYLPYELELKRLMMRDNLKEEEAKKRIRLQETIELKRLRADVVIYNSESFAKTKKQVETWLHFLNKEYK
ncbi:MAG: dephospho-CoA kinase [Lactobacillales bacterium]|jgi:dephospho-CoA kinase|nr:dephospho-CoA kinase [Lactobacillales bacterium]